MNTANVKKPSIMMLITKADIGGAQIHVLTLIRNLAHQYDFTLVCGEEGYLTDELRKLSIDVILIPSLQRQIGIFSEFAAFTELRNLIKSKNPDLVHAHSSKAGVLGRLAGKSAGCKVVFTAHGWAFTEGAGFLQRSYGLIVEWLVGRLKFDVISVSEYDLALAKKYKVINSQNGWLIKNGVKPITINRTEDRNSVPVLLNIGRLARAKNQELLIRAISLLDTEFKLVIVGDGHKLPGLVTLAEELKVTDKLLFVTQSTDISEWFSQADIFVLSSSYEGLPLSIIEAMSCKLPVVATDVGGVKELVKHESSGFLVKKDDEKMLAHYLNYLIQNPRDRRKLGDEGEVRYLKNFTAEKMCELTRSVYKSNIENK